MKHLLLKLFKIENDLADLQEETNEMLDSVLKELKGIRLAIETNNKAHGITEENGY